MLFMTFFFGHASKYWNRLSLSEVMLFHCKYAEIYGNDVVALSVLIVCPVIKKL